jgi:hypothetical protein
LAEIVKERPQPWHFTHKIVRLKQPFQKLLDIQPLGSKITSLWIALTVDGTLLSIDLSDVSSQVIAHLSEAKMSWIAEGVNKSLLCRWPATTRTLPGLFPL